MTGISKRSTPPAVVFLTSLFIAGCLTSSGLQRYEPKSLPPAAPMPCRAPAAGKVVLPADDGQHPQPVEWWYWTGHLKTDDGRWFGFEEVFFRAMRRGSQTKMAQLAVTDIARKDFRHMSVVGLGDYPAVADGFDLGLGTLGAIGGGGRDHLRGAVERYALDLDLQAQKAPVLQHGDGYTDYAFGGNTYYYSRERMAVEGTLSVDGAPVHVTGTAWFDHQYGDILKAVKLGWDWFALQLDDGRDLMLFVVRAPDGPVLVGGSMSDTACETSEVRDVHVTPLGRWVSPHTGCEYPMGWGIELGGKRYEVHPVLEDQELHKVAGQVYWEGASTVTGDATGRAYVELTGYCPHPTAR